MRPATPGRSAPRPVVLIVEDSSAEARLSHSILKGDGYDLRHAATGRGALDMLAHAVPEIVLLDLKLPDMTGLKILEHVAREGLQTSVVVLTGNASLEVAVSAMRLGAFDYIVKPYTAARLRVTVRNAVERQRLARLVDRYRDEYAGGRYCGFIGASPAMQAVYRTIEAAASSKATVFITGESGTGKELCAQAVHARSPRSDEPFVVLNCAAIPRELVESEIFGHARGAFTGAMNERDGAALQADGGTLFLDEICELSPGVQTKLLRFVQTGSFRPIGSDRMRSVDARFVCATNRDPWAEVEAERLREDLYYRMHVIPIALPPLREREDDVLAIADALLLQFAREEGRRFTRFTPEAAQALMAYAWPGNVRELQNVIRRIVVLNDGEAVTAPMLPPPLAGLAVGDGDPRYGSEPLPPETAKEVASIRPLWRVEKETIERAIHASGGNVVEAAQRLGISPSTIYRKRRAWRQTGET